MASAAVEQTSFDNDGGFSGLCKVAVVTGASGFVGAFVIKELLAQGIQHVRALDMKRNDHLGVLSRGEQEGRVTFHICDIRDSEAARALLHGADAVFHCAATFGSPSFSTVKYLPPKTLDVMRSVNVDATASLVASANSSGVRAFLYTSTVNVAFDGTRHLDLATEDLVPNVAAFADAYCLHKREAEGIVLAADRVGDSCMRTGAVRPNGVWGPSAGSFATVRALEGTVWPLGLRGGIFLKPGSVTDWSHVQNIVNAMLLMATHFLRGGDVADRVGGNAYNITDGEVITSIEFMGRIVTRMGMTYFPVVPFPGWLMVKASDVVEYICWRLSRVFRPHGRPFEPLMTRSMSLKIQYDNTFSIERAKRDFGYRPLNVEPLVTETADYLSETWGRVHMVHPVSSSVWLTICGGMLFSTALAFCDVSSAGRLPLQLTKTWLFDWIPNVSRLNLDEYQRIVLRQCIFKPMVVVHVLEAIVAFGLAVRRGSILAPLWSFRTLLLGMGQLRFLTNDAPAANMLVLAIVGGCFGAAPFLPSGGV
eukprot:TRINITY_DN64542_c0_g1_i1.p1 TRINITY_DN64542_c0_g1~~TRINITY_DN64542_c0_g1_i1.p1  ORF type:complete len:551 (-),score=54.28 TRINITY_DN64542_c0_g1_i1:63-1670(-)